jgi:hypothetical protein
LFSCFSPLHQHWKHLYLHPAFGRSRWRLSNCVRSYFTRWLTFGDDQILFNSLRADKMKNTKTNKSIIVKNRKLATQNFLFNMHINFPFGNIKRLSLLCIQFLEGADAGCLSLRSYFYPTSDVWRWPNPVKIPNVPFLLLNPQWNQSMNSIEPCK